MADIAQIGFFTDTSDLVDAERKLDALVPAAAGAEKSANKLTSAFDRLSTGGTLLSRVFGGMQSVFAGVTQGVKGFFATLAAGFAANEAISGARELSKSIAELTTAFPAGSKEIEKITEAAARMAREFGTSQAAQITATYEAVSAGATSTAAAIDLVDNANKLAIGGFTDISTAVDVLTGVVNAYEGTNYDAAQASDALFVAVAAGKTRIREMAQYLGEVIPTAANAGVGFDELAAAIAALTLGSIRTPQAATALNAFLNSILKPSAEATDLAKQLGIQYDVTALKTKGLSGFLKDLSDKTKGNSTAFAILAGGSEALKSVLALTANEGAKFDGILEKMASKAGATKEAFDKVSNSLEFRFNRLLQSAASAATAMGYIILAAIVPIGEAIEKLIMGTSPLSPLLNEVATVLMIAFGPVALGAIASMAMGVATMTASIVGGLIPALSAAVTAMITFAAANPFTALAVALGTVLAAAYVFRDKIEQIFSVDVVSSAISGANTIAAKFIGAYRGVVAVWSGLGDAMKDIVISAVNYVILATRKMINNLVMSLNGLLASLPEWLGGGENVIKYTLELDDAIVNDAKGKAAEIGKIFGDEMRKADQTTWVGKVGGVVDAVKGKLGEIAKDASGAKDQIKQMLNVPTSGGMDLAKGAGAGAGSTLKALTELQQIAKDLDTLKDPYDQAANAFSALRSAMDAGVISNDQYASSLARIEQAFLRVGGTSAQWSNIVGSNTAIVNHQLTELAENSLNRLGDEFINLAVDGKANFADLARSIVKDLLKIAWQALITRSIMGFFRGNPGNGALNILPNAKGGVYEFANGGAFTNSVVAKPTLFAFANGGALGVMGEAGPEAIMPLQRGPDGSLGVQMYGGARPTTPTSNEVTVNNSYVISGAISSKEITEQIRASAENTKETVKKSVVQWLDQYNQDGTI